MTRFGTLHTATFGLALLSLVACTRPSSGNGAGATPSKTPESTVTAPAAASATAPAASASSAAAPSKPRTEEECRTCNGEWGQHGLTQIAFCNCRTKDPGKRCRDGAECEGLCVADEVPEREVVKAGPPPLGYYVGKCSDVVKVFGCRRFIARGAASEPPHDLSEPLPKICFD
ncbi:MAG: hypothetical protein QM756_25165 [Polyangiaceae bacterium]